MLTDKHDEAISRFSQFFERAKNADLLLYTEWNWNLQSCACAVAAITRTCDRVCTVITQFTDTIGSTTGGIRSITGMGDHRLKEAVSNVMLNAF